MHIDDVRVCIYVCVCVCIYARAVLFPPSKRDDVCIINALGSSNVSKEANRIVLFLRKGGVKESFVPVF